MLSISQLFVHPLKSAKSLELKEFTLNAKGPEFDRHWMVIDTNNVFLSQRHHPKMCLIDATVDSNGLLSLIAPGQSMLQLNQLDESARTINAEVWRDKVSAQDEGDSAAAWLSQFLKTPCRLVSMPKQTQRQVNLEYAELGVNLGFADGFPLLVISQASLDHLNDQLDTPIGIERFRPNIVINGATAHAEDDWQEIQIGDIRLSLVKKCSRCVIPSIDPATAVKQANIIATLSRYRRDGRDINFGMNALHRSTGTIRVGDSVEIIR